MDKSKVLLGTQDPGIIERGAIIELIKRYYIVLGIGECEVADEPASARLRLTLALRSDSNINSQPINEHESSPPSNQNVLRIRKRRKFGGPLKNWSFSPDSGILEVTMSDS